MITQQRYASVMQLTYFIILVVYAANKLPSWRYFSLTKYPGLNKRSKTSIGSWIILKIEAICNDVLTNNL